MNQLVLTRERLREIAREVGEQELNRKLSETEVDFLCAKFDELLQDLRKLNELILSAGARKGIHDMSGGRRDAQEGGQ